MELHQLRYFVSIADTGSFSKAAQHCFVAQPSLSQQIKKLEDEFGQRLFDRLGRRIALTPFGVQLLPQARSILRQVAEVHELGTRGGDPETGRLSIGTIPTIESLVLSRTIRRFGKAHPGVQLSLREDRTENLMDALMNVKLDLGLMSLPVNQPRLETEWLLDEPLLLAIHAGHALAHQEVISVDDVQQEPFIALEQEQCLGRQIHSFCQVNQVHSQIVCSAAQVSTICRWVADDLGVALIPAMATRTAADRNIRYRRLPHEQLQRPIVAVRLSGRSRSPPADAFVELFTQECNKALTASSSALG